MGTDKRKAQRHRGTKGKNSFPLYFYLFPFYFLLLQGWGLNMKDLLKDYVKTLGKAMHKGHEGYTLKNRDRFEIPHSLATFSDDRRGFTLIELLIVMIIIGLLAALVGPKMFGKVEKSRLQAARAQISLFETSLDTYRLDNRHYPSTSEGLDALVKNPGGDETWDGPYVKKIPKDPWGHDYVYSCDSPDAYVIASCGPDGAAHTEDDVSSEESAGSEQGSVIPPG